MDSYDFCVWLLSLSIMYSRFIRAVACVSTSFLCMPLNNVALYGHTVELLIHSSADGHLGCLHFLVIKNNTA